MNGRNLTDRGHSRRLSRRRVVQGGLALAGLGFAACTPSSSTPTTAPAPPAAAPAATTAPAAPTMAPTAAAKRGGTFRSALTTAWPHFDFQQMAGPQSYENPVLAYSTLVTVKYGKDIKPPSYLPAPDIAESWEQPDELTYIFKIRRGVKFHNLKPVNGRELTAEDVRYSYQRVIDLKFLASLLGGIQKMETPDPNTLRINLAEPNADFLVNLGASNLVIVPLEAVEVNGDLKNGPLIGTGPWMVETADAVNGIANLNRNPDYFLKGLPYLDRLEFRRVSDPQTLVSAFRAKQLDFIGSGLSPQDTDVAYKSSPSEISKLTYYNYGASDELGFKSDAPPFDDPRVRKALVLAMDRQALIDGANSGYAVLTSGVFTPDLSWQLSADTLKPLFKRDLTEAKRLLAEAGKANVTFELTVPTYKAQVYVTMGEQLKAQLAEAGITANLKVLDSANYAATVTQRGEFTAYLGNNGTRLTVNADLLNRFHSKGAVAKIQTHYNNPKLDALIDQQRVLGRDPEKRRSLLEQVQRTVIEDNILVSISTPGMQDLYWNYVKDYYPNGVVSDSNAHLKSVWLDK
jgi:peptide/nickel transport system substrate-binding protein